MAYNWKQFKNGLFGFSHDYTELLAELKTDVATGDVGDKIVRPYTTF